MINAYFDPKKLGATGAAGAIALCGVSYSVAPCVNRGATSATKHILHGSFVAPVAPVAPSQTVGATRKPAWLLTVAPVALVAPQKTGQEVENRGGHE